MWRFVWSPRYIDQMQVSYNHSLSITVICMALSLAVTIFSIFWARKRKNYLRAQADIKWFRFVFSHQLPVIPFSVYLVVGWGIYVLAYHCAIGTVLDVCVREIPLKLCSTFNIHISYEISVRKSLHWTHDHQLVFAATEKSESAHRHVGLCKETMPFQGGRRATAEYEHIFNCKFFINLLKALKKKKKKTQSYFSIIAARQSDLFICDGTSHRGQAVTQILY